MKQLGLKVTGETSGTNEHIKAEAVAQIAFQIWRLGPRTTVGPPLVRKASVDETDLDEGQHLL